MKKIFAIIAAVGLIGFGNVAMASPCEGPDCEPTVNADIQGAVGINGQIIIVPNGQDQVIGSYVQDPDSNDRAGNFGTANVTLNADAAATGMDTEKRVKVGYDYSGGEPGGKGYYEKINGNSRWTKEGDVKYFRHGHPSGNSDWVFRGRYKQSIYETVIVAGESEAYGRNELTLTSNVDVVSNSPQTSGLASTDVHATTTLGIDGVAWAKGTDGCPQTASIDVDGSITAYAYGNSFSGDLGGAYASAGGSGLTTVDFTGHEYDVSTSDHRCSPNKAYVDFDTIITVDQHMNSTSYVSPDGTRAETMAFVGGGYGQSTLGTDGSILGFVTDRDNIQLTGISASGKVSQSSRAIGGGAVAYGSSSADFSGAYGSIETIPGRQIFCWTEASPGQIANVGGHAVVTGYNNVDVSGNSITVTSVQHGYATTGNSGSVQIQESVY